jgi:hypothetical protein
VYPIETVALSWDKPLIQQQRLQTQLQYYRQSWLLKMEAGPVIDYGPAERLS